MEILPLFCEIDDFCKVFERLYQTKAISNGKSRKRAARLSQSEVMTIPVMYHLSGYKNLKAFYLQEVLQPTRFGFSATLQLSAVCPITIEMPAAVVFLSVEYARRLHGHFIY